MDDAVEQKEGEPVNLQTLYILVHPFHKIAPNDIPMYRDYPEMQKKLQNRFRGAREKLAFAAMRMLPQNGQQITYFMPQTIESRGDVEKEATRQILSKEKESQWPDLYRKMQQALPVDLWENMMRGFDFVGNIGDHNFPKSAQDMINHLVGRGFALTSETQIVMGGEWLNACLQSAVDSVLGLVQVRRVSIFKPATLTAGYYLDSHPDLEQKDYDSFKRHFSESDNYSVHEEGEYIIINKRNAQQ